MSVEAAACSISGAPGRSRPVFRAAAAVLVLAFAWVAPGCARWSKIAGKTSPSPAVPSPPPPRSAELPPPGPPALPAALAAASRAWTLAELVDVGLLNSPRTRAAWQTARAAASVVSGTWAAYAPQIELNATATKTKGSAIGGRFVFDYSSFQAGGTLDWVLLDAGGRAAEVERARQILAAANYAHSQAVEDVILQVEQAYYQYLAVLALAESYRTTLKEAEANLEAANARHEAGVATIADVLQARTSYSQARFNLVSAEGSAQVLKGSLAAAMGLQAETPFDVRDQLPEELPLDSVSGSVDGYIREALTRRPDLAAAQAQVLQARANIRYVRSQGLPTLGLNGSYDRVRYLHTSSPNSIYSIALTLTVPLTTGIANGYLVLQARAQEAAARAEADLAAQGAALQVWTDYYDLKTAAERIAASADVLTSAQASVQVAFETYRQGVGSILDLLTAQNALATARVQPIQARTDWLIALAQFAHDTGTLGPPVRTPAGDVPVPPRK